MIQIKSFFQPAGVLPLPEIPVLSRQISLKEILRCLPAFHRSVCRVLIPEKQIMRQCLQHCCFSILTCFINCKVGSVVHHFFDSSQSGRKIDHIMAVRPAYAVHIKYSCHKKTPPFLNIATFYYFRKGGAIFLSVCSVSFYLFGFAVMLTQSFMW